MNKEYSREEAMKTIARVNKKYNENVEQKHQSRIDKTYEKLSKAQDLVVGTKLEDMYFDYLYYQMKPMEDGYDIDIDDLIGLQKSANAIIEMVELSKEVKHIFG
tara:strand:+ start:225 stop:536 length:312 start_codon:yes stop_codon:yes gene_type:complete